ncbi:hypothetical protein HDU89_007390 [Geranomyces variabilis]|nr:hypothetical protein HDU89_007390 [Geranomyces variabilis]KAJ3174093.1 hypothetical protein HDU88_000060 [Geranomyces variabilis]
MAQGKFKKVTAASGSKSVATSSSAIMKKHSKKQASAAGPKAREGKFIAPKAKALITQKNLQKKLSARSIVQTERLMAARAGATGKLNMRELKKTADDFKAENAKKK